MPRTPLLRLAPALPFVALLSLVTPARARMDIENNGPVLDAGRFGMRITNVGVIGNAFFNKGLSFDPSFEFPKGSGHECLEHAELWVGATLEDGSARVSGGPVLEWRPTLAADDVVLRRYAGDRGTRSGFDDDGDGRVDEELLDGRDNDGDGEVDEDLRFPAQETCSATYTDDTKEAVEFGYETGEVHQPLGLQVTQEAHAWTQPGFSKIAGLHFTIKNRGTHTLREVRLGLFANLDSRERSGGGHTDDRVTFLRDSLVIPLGTSVINAVWQKSCFLTLKGTWPAVHDAGGQSEAPWTALVGLSHTTDPLNYITNVAFPGVREAHAAARAPAKDTAFTYSVFSQSLPPRQGGPPTLDVDRMAALRGEYAQADPGSIGDYSVLLSCGPFRVLEPGQTLEFMVALVAGENADSLAAAVQAARLAWRGTDLNLLPDKAGTLSYRDGETGTTGHETCYEPPPGIVFNYDPHCPEKFVFDPAYRPFPQTPPPFSTSEATYQNGVGCIWTDLDCDACTGLDGRETTAHWFVAAPAPPQPTFRSTAGDNRVTIEWDNLPEILADASVLPGAPYTFYGYRVYRLDQWSRESLLPPDTRWQQVVSFSVDTTLGARPLAEALQTGIDYDSVAYERRHYPVGRYKFTDTRVLDGFDYHYVVTAVAQRRIVVSGTPRTELLESPFRAIFSGIVRPRFEAGRRARDGKVWVVPNPFRGSAPWERDPVPGDVFTRHLDFFGLPRAVARIRIYTLAGDLVQELTHDGREGDGQQAWDLISRNGQDVESGVYLFTVDWPGGHEVGRFVVIR